MKARPMATRPSLRMRARSKCQFGPVGANPLKGSLMVCQPPPPGKPAGRIATASSDPASEDAGHRSRHCRQPRSRCPLYSRQSTAPPAGSRSSAIWMKATIVGERNLPLHADRQPARRQFRATRRPEETPPITRSDSNSQRVPMAASGKSSRQVIDDRKWHDVRALQEGSIRTSCRVLCCRHGRGWIKTCAGGRRSSWQ